MEWTLGLLCAKTSSDIEKMAGDMYLHEKKICYLISTVFLGLEEEEGGC